MAGFANKWASRAKWALRPGMVLILISIVTGIMHMLVAPPWEYVVLHPVSWIAAFMWIDRCRPWGAFWSGWLIGTASNMAVFRWIVSLYPHRSLPFCLMILLGFGLISGLYVGIFAAGWRRVRHVCGAWWPIGIAAWFTACEFLNPQLFPNGQGCPWYQQSWIFPVVSLAGVPIMTFIVILCNTAQLMVVESVQRSDAARTRGWVRNAVGLAACIAIACGWSAWQKSRWEGLDPQMPAARIALINPTGERFAERGPRWDALQTLTTEAVATEPGMVAAVWPENALWIDRNERDFCAARQLARQLGIEIWTGAHYDVQNDDGTLDRSNSALHIDSCGRCGQRYDKCVLAPIGEAIPVLNWFPSLEAWYRGKPSLQRGQGPMVYDTPAGRIAFLICYETINYSHVRSVARTNPDLLVVISSDSWANQSACAPQHFMLAALNAAQFGVPLVRCANGGICGSVDSLGRITDRSESCQQHTLICPLHRAQVAAPYLQLGDWFAWGCVLANVLDLLRPLKMLAVGILRFANRIITRRITWTGKAPGDYEPKERLSLPAPSNQRRAA